MKITEIKASDLVRTSMEAYAKEVIEDRALPDLRDGLKPSQRRILYYMASENLTAGSHFKTSAAVVGGVLGRLHPHGDCLAGDTLVYSLETRSFKTPFNLSMSGTFHKIKDLVNREDDLWVLAYDEKTGQTLPAKAHSFRIGTYTNKIFTLTLSDGSFIRCTNNHPFYIIGGWKKAEDFKIGDLIGYLVGKSEGQIVDLLLIGAIDIEELTSPVPMYDFTVDQYHNMLLPTCYDPEKGTATFIIAHNSSIYGTLVGLNNNTISPVHGDGDGWGSVFTEASAMRYTKTKMSKFGERFCDDLHIADFVPNYSGDSEEPIIIPAPLPYALLAGTSGIAVAVATCIPAHNLKELVNTFVSILYGEQDLDKLIGKTLLGPESKSGGTLISSQEEIADMYRNGKGKLRWRCNYSLSCTKSQEWILIVDSIPECFSLNSWLEKMKTQAENGTLRIENESCASDPIRFSIRFNNPSVFEEIIEPSLYCYENYNFNLILRSESLQETELQHHNFLSWADAWLTWREDVEIKLVNAKILKLEKELVREGVKLWAVSRIDEIIALLKKSMVPLHDLAKTFKLSIDQAKIVAEMQLQAISRLSKEKQEQTLKRLNGELQSEKEKLKNPKALVEATLMSLMQFNKPRIGKIDYGNEKGEPSRKALKKFEGKPTYWAVEQKNPKYLINLGSEIPLRKRAVNTYLGLIDATKGMMTVSEKGVVNHLKLQKLTERDLGNVMVGIIPLTAKYFSISVNNGLIADYMTEQSVAQWTSKLLQEGDDKVLSVVYYNDRDALICYSDDEINISQIKGLTPMIRSNKSGRKAFKKLRGRKDVWLKVIPYGYSIYFVELKKCVSFPEIIKPSREVKELLLKQCPYFLYHDDVEMYCVSSDGCRFILKGNQILAHDIVETYIV